MLPDVEGAQSHIKNRLLETVNEVCGWKKGSCVQHKETWWWNYNVDRPKKGMDIVEKQ